MTKAVGAFFWQKGLPVSGNEFQQFFDATMTTLQKLFFWIASGNIIAAGLAFLDMVPKIAPAISLIFVVWVGVLAIREKKLSNRLKELQIEDKERQREVDEARG